MTDFPSDNLRDPRWSRADPSSLITPTSTTLADLFEVSSEGSPAMGTSIGRRASENGEHGAAAALQVGVGDHRHERVAMQAMPGSAFEVVEAKFFLELLVGLLADPSGLDRGGERLEAGVGRQVGKIVFALARGATLADQPGLLARHVLHALVMDALRRTIGDPHAYGGEGSRQRPFGSLAPADASPLCGGENVFSRRGELIGDVALARPPASGDRKREPDMARIDFLPLGDSDRPLQ